MTTSLPASTESRSWKLAALSLRLTVLRVTAFPTLFATMKPKRAGPSSFLSNTYMTVCWAPAFLPYRTVWR